MEAGDLALSGDADVVGALSSWFAARTVGNAVHGALVDAALGLGGQSGAPVSVTRLLTSIQSGTIPAQLLQLADTAAGEDLGRYASRLADTSLRARSAPDAALAAAFDEERRVADHAVSSALVERRGDLARVRRALPQPPGVSAGVSVPAALPNGGSGSLSAFGLARLQDPARIRRAWNSMSASDRQRLIDDAPLVIGNLGGIPVRDRHTANVVNALAYRDDLERQIALLTSAATRTGSSRDFAATINQLEDEVRTISAMLGDRNPRYSEPGFGRYTTYDAQGRRVEQAGTTIVAFHPLRDSFVTYQGPLDPDSGEVPAWVGGVGLVVPGTRSKLARFTESLDRTKDFVRASDRTTAYFTWHGSPMPDFAPPQHIIDPARRGFAEVAGPRLAAFANGLQLPPETDLVPVAHSYGAAVLGRAELLGMHADRVVYVAPAGIGHGAASTADFPNTRHSPHFVLQARNDVVVGWNQGSRVANVLRIGHGVAHPLRSPDIVRLETGHLEHGNPASGTIESTGGAEAHASVFAPKSTSVRNITAVVQGDPVSLYQENDVERVRTRGRVPRSFTVERADTGAEKPEILVPSRAPFGGQR